MTTFHANPPVLTRRFEKGGLSLVVARDKNGK